MRNFTKNPCTCFLEIKSCYCTTAQRFIVRNQDKEDQSVWDTLDEAVSDGRKHLAKFKIFDTFTNKHVVDYER